MLLVVQRLDVVDRDGRQRTDRARKLVLALYENRVLEAGGAVGDRTVGIPAETDHIARVAELSDCVLTHLTDAGQISARDDGAGCIHNTDRAIHRIFHLKNNRLEQSGSHFHHLSFFRFSLSHFPFPGSGDRLRTLICALRSFMF